MSMKPAAGNAMTRRQNLVRTALYILQHNGVCRQDLAQALGLSMPTVFQNVSSLLEAGLICESGEYRSTGGRKAKILSVCENRYCTAGLEIMRGHIRLVLSDLSRRVMDDVIVSEPFSDSADYYGRLTGHFTQFLEKNGLSADASPKLLCAGLALPGIIDPERKLLIKSHALCVENLALCQFEQALSCPVVFDNDANFAAFAEVSDKQRNTLYLSLNETVGGAFYENGSLYPGDHFKSCEFGHMILVPNGRKCYCGKKGCMDAYCSSRVLQHEGEQSPEGFFARLERGESETVRCWERYLDDLSVVTANLRMAYDCRIVLGGLVGGYLPKYLPMLQEKLKKYNLFDADGSYVTAGRLKQESVCLGAAWKSADWLLQTSAFWEEV